MDANPADADRLQHALRAEERRRLAMLAGDAAALEALLADSLRYVHGTGDRDSKATYLDKLRSGNLLYLTLAFDALEARAAGTAVVVTGRMSALVTMGGQDRQVHSLFMTVWAPRADAQVQGAWQLYAYQGTPDSRGLNAP